MMIIVFAVRFFLPLTVNDRKLNILGHRMSISQLIFALKLCVSTNLIQNKLP